MSDTLSSDQAASLEAVIAQEKRSVAHYTELLTTPTTAAWAARWEGLRAYHERQIKRRREELGHDA